MLDDTLVIVVGEFGRTVYSQATHGDRLRTRPSSALFQPVAGGGESVRASHGETDDFSYNIVRDPVHVRDLQATILHLFGIDHEHSTGTRGLMCG
jgi:hypothetical protein